MIQLLMRETYATTNCQDLCENGSAVFLYGNGLSWFVGELEYQTIYIYIYNIYIPV